VAGAGEIVVVDPNENKLQLARELGATLMVDAADPDCVSRIREWTRGGVDHAFEMAGAAKATEAAYRVTRRGGTTVIASFPAGNVLLPVSQASLVGEERTIKGSYFGSAVPVRDVPRLVRLFKAGRLPVDRIADATVGLDGLNAAFDSLAEGNALRQILVP
jgi:alcohol dehydrogenase